LILVTGATGFIGGRLAERLAIEGEEVRCLARASSDTSALEPLDVEIAIGDLRDPGSIARAIAGCTAVFHCAALVSDWAVTAEIEQINVAGTRHVLEAALGARVRRLIHFSTTDIYGHPGAAGVDETYKSKRFANWYAHTKRRAEAEVQRVEREHGLATVILRPATVYGPGSRELVGEIARALCNGTMVLIDRGRAIAGLCFVENLIDAAVLALRRDIACGQAFNLTDGLDITWRRFTNDLARGLGCSPARWSIPYGLASAIGVTLEHGYRLLRRMTGLTTRPLLSRQAVQVLGINQAFSSHRAQALLGWQPAVSYATGLDATLAWLQTELG
jgi:nucleoside-diphosphate-sugar epimerase